MIISQSDQLETLPHGSVILDSSLYPYPLCWTKFGDLWHNPHWSPMLGSNLVSMNLDPFTLLYVPGSAVSTLSKILDDLTRDADRWANGSPNRAEGVRYAVMRIRDTPGVYAPETQP